MSRRRRQQISWSTFVTAAVIAAGWLTLQPTSFLAGFIATLYNVLLLLLAVAALLWVIHQLFSHSNKLPKEPCREPSPRPGKHSGIGVQCDLTQRVHEPPESSAIAMPVSISPHRSTQGWSLQLIQELEWKRFEQLCEAYFRTRNLDARMTGIGADGGVDIRLYKHNSDELFALMQCKAWSGRIGVKPVRELYGVMAAEGIERGIFLCSGDYTQDAKDFCEGRRLRLIGGQNLLNAILKLTPKEQLHLLTLATEGDYQTPTCPKCDIKLVERTGRKGVFWGCTNYPRCRHTMPMRKQHKQLTKTAKQPTD